MISFPYHLTTDYTARCMNHIRSVSCFAERCLNTRRTDYLLRLGKVGNYVFRAIVFLTQLPPQRVNSTQLPGEFSFPVLILSDFV
jgi:hypothetical protein